MDLRHIGFLLVVMGCESCSTNHSVRNADTMPEELPITITNFRAGLVCNAEPSFGWICFETEDVKITGQGDCVFDGQDEACTWYGFEFQYENEGPNTEIECVSKSDKASKLGNPRGVVAESTDVFEYTIPLKRGLGRFFNPQYTVFSVVRSDSESEKQEETTCSFNDVELFKFRFTISRPSIEFATK